MSPCPVLFLAAFDVLAQPIQKTLAYWLWYSALLWIPVRVVAALIDRRNVPAEQEAAPVAADDNSYRVGMPILPEL